MVHRGYEAPVKRARQCGKSGLPIGEDSNASLDGAGNLRMANQTGRVWLDRLCAWVIQMETWEAPMAH